MRDEPAMLDAAVAAVVDACAVARSVQNAFVHDDHALTKEDRSPVTVADFAVQALISYRLQEAFPHVAWISEENAEELGKAENRGLLEQVHRHVVTAAPGLTPADVCRLLSHPDEEDTSLAWVLDPIDGTKGFIRGDQYAVALGLVAEGKVVLGAMGCPNYETTAAREGRVFYARHGGGAFSRSLATGEVSPICVHSDRALSEAVVIQGVESAHSNFGVIGSFADRLGIAVRPLQMDGQGKYAAVACGDATAYLRVPRPGSTRKECIWDHISGVTLVAEAGGTVTDIDGDPLDFSHGARLETNMGVVASSGQHHAAILDALQSAHAES